MASFKFKNTYLKDFSTISSQNEKINTKFTIKDYYYGEKTTEEAEMKMQKTVLKDLERRNKIDFIIGADLSNQIAVTNKAMSEFPIPFLGIYNACASFVEGLILSSALLTSTGLKNGAVITSSHNLGAERTFRFPIEYGSPKRITQNFTATGAIGVIVSKEQTNIKLESYTIGKIYDYGIKDANNMGAIMAPSAAKTLIEHLKDLKRDPSYYDVIITGDLGKLGSELFKELLSKENIVLKNHVDAGSELIVDENLTSQGASGPVCLPLYLIEKILTNNKYKKILIIGTGALHNSTIVNQKNTLPGISHIVSLEVE